MLKKMTLKSALLALACAAALSGNAIADTTKNVHIEAGELTNALDELAEQCGVEFFYVAEQLKGLRTKGLQGEYTAESAVTKLLEGTNLKLTKHKSGALLISDASAPSSESPQYKKADYERGERNERLRIAQSDPPRDNGAEPEAADVVELEQVIVTGTWLYQTTPTSPVIAYSREDIERGGYTSIQDLMARVPQNFSSVNTATGTAGGSNVGMTTLIDLRGLGAQSTLTLVNGRRVAAAAGSQGRGFDIAMLPVAAVERIDILTDGASALYGSDAVAGVVNVMLRRQFEGAETTVQYDWGIGDTTSLLVSQVVGLSWESGYFLAAGQYDKDDPVTYADIGQTSKDFRPRGGADYRVPGFGSPGTVYPAGFFEGEPFTTLAGPGGAPVFFATLPAGDGGDVQLSQLGLNQRTVFDPMSMNVNTEQENASVYLTGEQTIGPVTLFADGVFAKRDGLTRLAPNVTFLDVPTSNAYSPFAEPVIVGYVLNELGAITPRAESEGWFANLGMRGEIGGSGWSWEVVGSESRDEFSTRFPSVNNPELARRLALSDPLEAFNPFGDGSLQRPDVIQAVMTSSAFHGLSKMSAVSTQLQGPVVRLPGGDLRLAVGGEYREEDLNTLVRRPEVPDNVLFPDAARDNYSVYAEASLPLVSPMNSRPGLQELVLNVAGRYEHYSDFGSDTNPKLGILWRPLRELALKATWGTSFRAPALRELYSVTGVTPNRTVFDPRAPGGARSVFATFMSGGNPNLGPETADTLSFTAEYEPHWLEGMRFSATRYDIRYTDRIRGTGDGLTPEFVLSIEDSLPVGIVQRDANGVLQTVNLANVNLSRANISGYDFAADYRWESAGWGRFGFGVDTTYFTENADQLAAGAAWIDRRGKVGSPPKWRGRANVSWSRGDWGASAALNYVDDLYNNNPDPRTVLRDVDAQTTVDMQLSYSPHVSDSAWLDGLSLRLGALNVFDADAPFVDAFTGFDPRNHIFAGRTLYLRAAKSFGPKAGR